MSTSRPLLYRYSSQLFQPDARIKLLHRFVITVCIVGVVILVGIYTTLFVLEGIKECDQPLASAYYDAYIITATIMYLMTAPILIGFWYYG